MDHKHGTDRNQMMIFSLESSIAPDSFVRVVDAIVDTIDMKSFGFAHVDCAEEGRPPYHPSILMKLYLYGYRYGIRTSRKLEREAQTNIEAIWLLSGLRPKYKTIADFRKKHSRAFREVFRRFVWLLKEWDLVEGETVAIDSFKIRASNSLKRNYNEKKLKHHIEYIDKQISEYEAMLDACDKEEDRQELDKKIQERKEKKSKYTGIKKELDKSDEEQISTTDPDSRSVVLLRNIINVGYNIQSSSDAKHKLLVEYDTGSVNDTRALSDMAIKTKELLGIDHMNVLADKGYHTGEELQRCQDNGITCYVSPKALSSNYAGRYPMTSFTYDRERDIYICPQGHEMHTTKTWHLHSDCRKGRTGTYRFRRYTTRACKTCTHLSLCTRNKHGRNIDRSEYADVTEQNARRVNENPQYYRLRQQVTEHPFGTLKRQRGFTHTNLRGKENVLGEVGLVFITYNLSRCISILGITKLIHKLRSFCFCYVFSLKRRILRLKSELEKARLNPGLKTIPILNISAMPVFAFK